MVEWVDWEFLIRVKKKGSDNKKIDTKVSIFTRIILEDFFEFVFIFIIE